MFKRISHTPSPVDQRLHPEHETRNTRVSEYLRKYGQGKIDSLPKDNRPEVTDERDTDSMLDGSSIVDRLDADQLDVMLELDAMADRYQAALADMELTQKQKSKFDKAIKVLQDKNASYEQRMDANRILDELEKTQKMTRARD